MERQPVVSSQIASIGYDALSKMMQVEFKNGAIYEYSNVQPEVHRGFMASESKGKYLHSAIRGHYQTKRI